MFNYNESKAFLIDRKLTREEFLLLQNFVVVIFGNENNNNQEIKLALLRNCLMQSRNEEKLFY